MTPGRNFIRRVRVLIQGWYETQYIRFRQPKLYAALKNPETDWDSYAREGDR